jgi:hypothetical protein
VRASADPPAWVIRLRASRWYSLPWHYLLLAAWAARWFQVEADGTHSWHLLIQAARLLFGGHPAGFTEPGGLHLYANYPRFQFGPVTLVVTAVLRLTGPGEGLVVAQVVMTLCGLAILAVAEWTARLARPEVDRDRLRWTVLGAGAVFLPAWEILAASFMHLDDVLALLLAVLAVRTLVARQPAATGILLALSGSAKPWAFGFLALLLALPPGRLASPGRAAGPGRAEWVARAWSDRRVRGLAWAVAVTVVLWAPFVMADTGTVATAKFAIPNVADSGLRALGINTPHTPSWDRPAQILLGLALSALAVYRGRWAAVLLICTSVRIGLDPNDYPYYNAGLVTGTLIWDLIGTRRPAPAWTLAAAAMFWGWNAVGDQHTLAGALRVGFAVIAAAYTILGPAAVPGNGGCLAELPGVHPGAS